MGSYGSGPYGAAGSLISKTATNSCLTLDVRRLKRQNALRPGLEYTSVWTRREGKSATIGINIISDDELQLNYTSTIDGVETPVRTRIELESTACNYGNKRVWFRCPVCHKRVALLYLKGPYFRCRHCHDLTYYSCQESGNFNETSMRRVNKVLAKLNSDERCSFDILYHTPSRPRYMHRKTYGRLLRQYDRKRYEYAESVRAKVKSFGCNARQFLDLPDGF